MKKMKQIGKYLGLTLLILLAFAASTYLFISHQIGKRAEKKYRFHPIDLPVSITKNTIARGEHLIAIKGCNDCHGADLGGKVFLEESGLGKISAPNLTSGAGGIGKTYQRSDWVNALRHGVKPNGQALWIMPSQESALLSDEDLSAIIAYCKQLEPVNRMMEANTMGPMLKVLGYFDKLPLFPVEKIDHHKTVMPSVSGLDQVATGKYLSVSCTGCHRDNLKGGDSPLPGMPPVPNITASGKPGKWTLGQFIHTLRTGKTPEGKTMDNQNMPWKMTAKYTDKELQALYAFLRSQT